MYYCFVISFAVWEQESRLWQHIRVYTALMKVSCHYLDNKRLEWKANRHMGGNVLCSYMLQEYVCHFMGFGHVIVKGTKEGLPVIHGSSGKSFCFTKHKKPLQSKAWRMVSRDWRGKCMSKGTRYEPIILELLRHRRMCYITWGLQEK